MVNTILKIQEENCYGCGACFNKCPTKAISMKSNSEGFLFPSLNKEKCIDCGLCLKVCPAENFSKRNENEPKCYAVWAEDSLRMKSSSGGMFSLLANYILKQGGYVCGAEFTENYTAVNHVLISKLEELDRLRRSKYIQSDAKEVYREIAELLEKGKLVLFSGCPCQVAGLYTFLGKEWDNLYTIDVVCHGGNSPKAYKAFLEERANGKAITEVNFREKEIYGWGTPTVIHFKNGEVFREGAGTCKWYKGFLNGIITRKSCGHCQFATQIRQSDITLGDFWGIEKYKKELNDNKGTSLVLVNSTKGEDLFKNIQGEMKLFEQIPYEEGWRRNGQLYQPQKLHVHRDLFFQVLDKYGYDKAIDCAVNYRLDIGVMGWWYNANYGGVATYYALHQLLRGLGYSVLMIDNPIQSGNPFYSQDDTMAYRFARKHYNCSKRYNEYDLRNLNAHCSTFIVGSDQMWNYWLRNLIGPAFYLGFATEDKKKIAYGSSFGDRYSVPEDWRSRTAYYVQRFDYVSVREDYAVQMAKDFYDIEAEHVVDPVFLCEKEEYDKIIKDSNRNETEPFICCYILNPSDEKKKIITWVSEKFSLPVKIILDAPTAAFETNAKMMDMSGIVSDVEEEDWMYYIKNSEYVITDSFHGVCFSIIFEKAFLCLANPKRGIERFQSLLRMLNLEKRLIRTLKELQNNVWLLDDMDYVSINQILSIKKAESLNWLKCALESSKRRYTSSYDILVEQNQKLKIEIDELKKTIELLPQMKTKGFIQKIKRKLKKG